jgi:hypothetical protein
LHIDRDLKQMDAIRDIKTWRDHWSDTHNTGNKYEIVAGEEILRHSGLDGNIRNRNNNKIFNDVTGIISHTQNDSNGTGDIEIVYFKKPPLMFSVTQYKKQLSKCIVNPSGKYYGIYKDEYRSLVNETYKACIIHKRKKYGDKPIKKWRDREKIPAVNKLHKIIARDAAKNWNAFNENDKIKKIKKFLDLDTYLNTRAYGIMFCSESKLCSAYLWGLNPDINLSNCLNAASDGIYVYHYIKENYKDTWFLRVQVKFNNGAIEFKKNTIPLEPKCGNTFTSWNSVVKMERIFNMTKLI